MTEIDNYLRFETFNFAFVNTLFDTNDFEKPIKYIIDDQLFFELNPHVIKKANFFI